MSRRKSSIPHIIRKIRPAFAEQGVNWAEISAIAHSIRQYGFESAMDRIRSETLRLRLRLVWEGRHSELAQEKRCRRELFYD